MCNAYRGRIGTGPCEYTGLAVRSFHRKTPELITAELAAFDFAAVAELIDPGAWSHGDSLARRYASGRTSESLLQAKVRRILLPRTQYMAVGVN